MNEGTMAFLVWAAVAAVFAALGVYCLFAKKAVGFWANAEVFEVTDTRRYNAAVAKLFFAFGVGTLLLGLPLLGLPLPLTVEHILGWLLAAVTVLSGIDYFWANRALIKTGI